MWLFNNIRIFVQENTSSDVQTIARLNPLNGGTIHQTFGYEDPTYNVSALVVGETDKDALKALSKTGTTYTLSGPYGVIGSFYVKSVEMDLQPAVYQTIRPDLDCESPIYIVKLELYEDV